MRILKIFGIIVISIVVLFYAANFAAKYWQSNLIKKDVNYIFEKNNVEVKNLKCTTPSLLSRGASCKFVPSDKNISIIAGKFKMEKVEKNNSNFSIDLKYGKYDPSACGISDISKVDIYHSRVKAKEDELRIDNGTAFEEMIIFYDPNKESFCVQIGYAYG